MRLSKVYRPETEQVMERLELLSFDAGGGLRPGYRASHSFVPMKDRLATPAAVAAPSQPEEPARPAISEQDLAAVREQARREGFEAGLKEGRQKLESSAEALAAALTEASGLRASILEHSRQDMLRLVLTIAEQILQRQFQHDPQAILPVVDRALQSALHADHLTLRVNPEDLAVVSENKPLFLAGIAGLKNLSIEADAEVSRGGCLVESALGDVDAQLETQLESIRQALDETLGAG